MGESTEELNRDIELTRQRLSRDVDELGDKVSPGQVVARQKAAARSRLGSVKDRVMGSAHGVAGSAQSAGSSVGDTASGAVEGLQSRTEGNPLAAGVIAFGAGMLISSMFPATRAEQRIGQQGLDAAKEHGQPVMDQAKGVAQEMGEQLKETAQDGMEQVKSSAQDSAQTLKDEGQSSAQEVRDQGGTTTGSTGATGPGTY